MRFEHMPNPPAAIAAIAIAACLALTGCSAEFNVGGGSDASGEEIATEIQSDYVDKTGIELPRLTCEGAEAEVGTKFSCSGRNENSLQLEISGKVTDTTADGFDYSWHVVTATAPGVFYERALRRDIEGQGIALSEVRCPVEVRIDVGSKLQCAATDRNGSSRKVTLRLTDLEGGFDYTVEGEGLTSSSSSS